MKYCLILIFTVTLVFTGCTKENNPTQSTPTIEDRINAERPINSVYVANPSSGNWQFSNGSSNPLNDAYAENGYLIVSSSSKHYFSLSTAKEIQISKNDITIRY